MHPQALVISAAWGNKVMPQDQTKKCVGDIVATLKPAQTPTGKREYKKECSG